MDITKQLVALCNYNTIFQRDYYNNKKVSNKQDNQYYYLHLLYQNFINNRSKKNGESFLEIPEYNNIFFKKDSKCYIKFSIIHNEVLKHTNKNKDLTECAIYQDYKQFYNFYRYGRDKLRYFLKKSPQVPSSLDSIVNDKSIQLSLPIEEKKEEEVIVNNALQVEIDNKKKEIEELEMLIKLSNKHGFNLVKNK